MENVVENYLTVEQVADLHGVSIAAIYKAIREGRLQAGKVLGRTAITRDEAARFEPASHGGARPNTGNRKSLPGVPNPTKGKDNADNGTNSA